MQLTHPHSSNYVPLTLVATSVVGLRERLVLEYERTGELLVDLGSDQTSLHNPFSGGYYPAQLSFRQANQLMATNPGQFRAAVQVRSEL